MANRREISTLRRRINHGLLIAMIAGGVGWGAKNYWHSSLSDGEAIEAVIELRLAQLELGETSAAARAARDAILTQHKISAKDLNHWLLTLRKRPGEWDQLQNQMIAKIDSLRLTVADIPVTSLQKPAQPTPLIKVKGRKKE